MDSSGSKENRPSMSPPQRSIKTVIEAVGLIQGGSPDQNNAETLTKPDGNEVASGVPLSKRSRLSLSLPLQPIDPQSHETCLDNMLTNEQNVGSTLPSSERETSNDIYQPDQGLQNLAKSREDAPQDAANASAAVPAIPEERAATGNLSPRQASSIAAQPDDTALAPAPCSHASEQEAQTLAESQPDTLGKPGVGDLRAGVGKTGKRGRRTKSSEGPGAKAGMSSEEANLVGQRLLEAWDHFGEHAEDRLNFYEAELATTMKAEDVVGRSVRVYWPGEEAWFAGIVEDFDAETGQHKVVYADGDVDKIWLIAGIERVRVLLPAQAVLDPPTAVELHTLSQALLKQSNSLEIEQDKVELKEKLQSCSLRLRWQAENMCQRGNPAHTNPGEAFPWGSIVWAKSKGYPPWPSLVITREDALAHGVKGARKNSVCVQAFGEFSRTAVKKGDVTPFDIGVQKGLHTNQRQAFQRGLFEVLAYLREGVLPEDMMPDHNDLGFSSDDEEDVPLAAAAVEEGSQLQDVKISKKLKVNSFGRVDFLHPAYHNAKHIWPRGYTSTSLVSSAASSDAPAEHVCEILDSPNGSGPLFRITCAGVSAESRADPQQAWVKLQGGRKERLTGQEGLSAFGLRNQQVRHLIEELPGARRCERYCCWSEDNVPSASKLTLTESRLRAKYEAEMQQLPEGLTPCEHEVLEGPRCDACGLEAEYEDNIMLQCDGPCRCFVHQVCAGVMSRPRGSWVCQLCKLGCDHPPACALCPVRGGLMMATKCGQWCHTACVLWTPQAYLEQDVNEKVAANISDINKARRNLLCSVCQQRYGSCVQCGGSSHCFTAFHPLCARTAGLRMESQNDEHFVLDDQPVIADAACTVQAQQKGPGKGKRRRLDGKSSFIEGTALGDGTRLVCYCKKHSPQINQSLPTGVAGGGHQEAAGPLLEVQIAGASQPGSLAVEHQEGCSRAAPFNHAARRGLRAPEAIAAGLAKRAFLQACPYQVTYCPKRAGVKVPASRCHRASSNGVCKINKENVDKKTVQTLSQRYWEMKATESTRVALGKSRIHGWGAITKTPHKKNDLVIEYSGELIRHSVADARELKLYDRLVGAGTYIFKMNETTSIDATRAGNLAHMLNHSCQPNCYSRTIEIVNKAGKREEHVVIIAKEDIPELQELTYDYRFSSSEILPCNCGAPNCCGRVNESGTGDSAYFRVPVDQLKPYKPSRAQ